MNNAVRGSANRLQILEGEGGEGTLRILGAACGKRLRAAANALKQDPHLLVTLLGTAMLARLGEAVSAKRRAHQKLLALWQQLRPGALFLPPWFHPEIQQGHWRLWSRKFGARETRRLERVLALFSRHQRRRAGEALRAREMDDALAPFLEIILGKVRARPAEEAPLLALTDGAWRWFRWRRKTGPDPATAAAMPRRQDARRRNAMHLLADALLARLLAEYDIPTPQDICYFVSGLLVMPAPSAPTPPPADR